VMVVQLSVAMVNKKVKPCSSFNAELYIRVILFSEWFKNQG
jgi:hypothetical protein